MNIFLKFSFLFFVASAVGVTPKAAVSAKTVDSVVLDSFEFLGCSGDWKEQSGKANIWRLTKENRVSYIVRHPGTCGLQGRNAKILFSNGNLDLNYDLYSKDGSIVMCECEYWARFTFGESAMLVHNVTFGGQPAEQRGSWPSGL
jgi:hypothetical protein